MLGLIALALAQDEQPPFGMDVVLGAHAGAVLGEWPDPGVSGGAAARLDLFPVPVDQGGARVGASVWARSNVWPLQVHTGADGVAVPFRTLQYGCAVAFRYDPALRVSGLFSFGFSRLDLEGYENGVTTIPLFTLEAGLRTKLGKSALFLDWTAHSGWGSAREAESGGWEDWWNVGGGVGLGMHVR